MKEVFESLLSAKHYRASDWTDCIGWCGIVFLTIFCLALSILIIEMVSEWTVLVAVLVGIAILLITSCFIFCFIMLLPVPEIWFKARLMEREESMKMILNRLNEVKYQARGINLKVGTYGAWIEFELAFKGTSNGEKKLQGNELSNLGNLVIPNKSGNKLVEGQDGKRARPSGPTLKQKIPQKDFNLPAQKIEVINVSDINPVQNPHNTPQTSRTNPVSTRGPLLK